MVRRVKEKSVKEPEKTGRQNGAKNIGREILRKIFHGAAMVGTVAVSVLLYRNLGIGPMKIFLLYLLLLVLFTEWLVTDLKMYLPFYREFERAKERHRLHGSAYCLIGALLALEFFTLKVAFVAVMMVALSDVATAVVGMTLGKHKIFGGPKSYEGALAGLVVNVLIGLFFMPIQIGLAMAICATIVEAACNIVDDNLAVPIVAGFVGQWMMGFGR